MIPARRLINPGTNVLIVLKADQPTGHQVAGVVADVLTKRDHPRGVKVRLTDGRIGRVQRIDTILHPAEHTSAKSWIDNHTIDCRNDSTPNSRTLADFLHFDEQSNEECSSQTTLEKEFPLMDSSLVAAILNDHSNVQAAREILKRLG